MKRFGVWGFVALVAIACASSALAAGPRIVRFGPKNQYVPRWQTYTLSVGAVGSGLQYRWWHQEPDSPQGHEIPYGEGFEPDQRRLSVPDAQMNRDYHGWYWCVVTDRFGNSVESPHGQVTVVGPPEITTQPVGQTVTRGSTITFTVAADPGAPIPVRYQWLFDGRVVTGATKPTLTLRNINTRRAGWYMCRITTKGGTTMSGGALLQVE